MLEIRVLGPLEVLADGRSCPLPGSGEQAVLALLALDAGHVVSAGALIDGSWADRPPANPANALQLRVSKLRRTLQTAGLDDVVVTRRPGYLLDVDPDAVDAHRFAR